MMQDMQQEDNELRPPESNSPMIYLSQFPFSLQTSAARSMMSSTAMMEKSLQETPRVVCKRSNASVSQNEENKDERVCKKPKFFSIDVHHINPHGLTIKKEIKESVLKRLVRQALGQGNYENPNTVTALHSLFDKATFSFEVKMLPNANGEFLCNLDVQGMKYTGVGTSRKNARAIVTRKALRDLFPTIATEYENEVTKCSDDAYEVSNNAVAGRTEDLIGPECHTTSELTVDDVKIADRVQNPDFLKCPVGKNGESTYHEIEHNPIIMNERLCIADVVASAIHAKYESIVSTCDEHLKRYSVLSGIVMLTDNDISSMKVICVTTGNKCVHGDQISTEGTVIFDCHAEILARRCLTVFLYAQLELAVNAKKSIFTAISERRYHVTDGIKFYLYVNSSPCGDGRIFNFFPSKKPESKKNASKRGILRVKLESGMGGIPVTEYGNMTSSYADYLKGCPLVLMCCSEKLMRANVLGVQGALLSHFVEPIYFDGVLIGDIFQKTDVQRAVYGRIEDLRKEGTPPPYRVHRPFIEGVSTSRVTTNVKAGKSCMNWIACCSKEEFINTKTGRTLDNRNSRLCKRNMFIRFMKLFTKLGNEKSVTSYQTFKEASTAYQQMKRMLFKFLENSGRGKWVEKPKELNCFFLDDDNLE